MPGPSLFPGKAMIEICCQSTEAGILKRSRCSKQYLWISASDTGTTGRVLMAMHSRDSRSSAKFSLTSSSDDPFAISSASSCQGITDVQLLFQFFDFLLEQFVDVLVHENKAAGCQIRRQVLNQPLSAGCRQAARGE